MYDRLIKQIINYRKLGALKARNFEMIDLKTDKIQRTKKFTDVNNFFFFASLNNL